MTLITVYSKSNCPQCDATKRKLKQLGKPFVEVDLDVDAEARRYVTEELGYRQAPVVVVNHELHWSGYMPAHLAKLA